MPGLHRLTPEGIKRFQEFLDSQGTSEAQVFDITILTNPKYALPAGDAPEVADTCSYMTRFDAAEYLASIIDAAHLDDPALDRGVWCWLAWLWFESLCATKNGYRDTKDTARWILNPDYTRYYRHLLAGPWFIYRTHRSDPDRARALLCTDVNKPGDVVEQIASRQELVTNPGLVDMVTRLYYNPDTQKLRKGAAGKGKGSVRRLVKILRQLDMVWDLYSTTAAEFLALLPAEFDRFKKASTS